MMVDGIASQMLGRNEMNCTGRRVEDNDQTEATEESQRIEFAIHKEVVEAFPCHHTTYTLDKPVHEDSPNIQNNFKT